jgi:hypothetical protein
MSCITINGKTLFQVTTAAKSLFDSPVIIIIITATFFFVIGPISHVEIQGSLSNASQ